MKKVLLVMLFAVSAAVARAEEKDSLLVMFWNVENFFDWTDQGTGSSDTDFSSRGSRFWTRSRFYAKCNAISKSLFWIGGNYGRMPDVIGFAEVENRGVLVKLLSSTLLGKLDYDIVHFESSDRRGIDVALMYRKSVFRLLDTSVKVPVYNGKPLATRDMLQVGLELESGQGRWDFIVCHHPSKYGGAELSQGRREAAMVSLKQMCDSLGTESIVVMGDFNDVPSAPQFAFVSDILENEALPLSERHLGTIRYEGKWELIDIFMTSRKVAEDAEMEIVRIPFLMTQDSRHSGEKPLRTYSGPRYLGGVSDHCPVILKITQQKKR